MALTIENCRSVTAVNWCDIETVLLDMDGTLLDLRFDNDFWLSAIPAQVARLRGISVVEAERYLAPIFEREAGQLNWYCLDFWSQTLGFNVAQFKRQRASGIAWRLDAPAFLQRLRDSHCKTVLITNAHPDTLQIKLEQVALAPYFDQIFSSHEFGHPKESQLFWRQLHAQRPFDPETTLFVDDSESVLKSAERYGIAHLITLRQPDSSQPPREQTTFPAIHFFDEIHEGLANSD